MKTYALKFSTITGRSTVHSPDCTNAQKRSGYVVTTREAADPKAAAKLFDEEGELTDRGLPFPKICACARGEAPKGTSLDALLTFPRSAK